MDKTNALKMRQNLGVVLKKIARTGKPILVERGRKPVAVLISLEDYRKRFVDFEADEKRQEIIQRIKKVQLKLPRGQHSLELIRELRSS